MPRDRIPQLSEPPPDPFRERWAPPHRARLELLGARFGFEADSSQLLEFVRAAYAGLPPQRFSRPGPHLRVRLALAGDSRAPEARVDGEPPRVRPLAGGGLLCGVMDTSAFVAITPRQQSALVVASADMLRFPYHIRYEMLEFAVYVLAARAQGLVPLHAGCVGRDGDGVLLLGATGSGKTTLTLHCLLHGLEFLAEDSVLVRPAGLLATGVANFLHVRADSLRFLDDGGRDLVRRATVIRRRSGVEKFEVDLRRPGYRLAPAPIRIRAAVFISPRSARAQPLLRPLSRRQLQTQLAVTQKYAAQQPGWRAFTSGMARLPAFELRRGRHPAEAVQALEELLAAGSRRSRGRR